MANEAVEQEEINLSLDNINPSIFSKLPKEGNVKEEIKTEDKLPEDDLDDLDDLEDPKETKETKKEESKETKETKETATEDSVISFFKSKYGEDIEGEFEEDLDGVDTYFKKVLEKEKASSILEGQEQLLDSNPALKALKEHLDAGYSVDSFLQKQQLVDWDKVAIKDKEGNLNEKLAEQIFREARRVKGLDEDEIQDAWETAKDKGVVEERTEASIKYLKKNQDERIQAQQDREKVQNDAIKKEEAEALATAEKILKSGNINGITIPADKIKELRKFSFEADKKGITERDKRIEAMTMEESLLLDYLLMNGFKDLGVKPKTNGVNPDAFKKLKEQQAAKKKVDLSSGGGTATNKNAINIKTLFN